jgi:aspartokinase-like uncharacterized kinase
MDDKEEGPAIVVKVGGSLFDLPDLGSRLLRWLAQFPPGEVLLVPGGGQATDVVREYDRLHGLGEERAHWLALWALALNARFLASLLPGAVVLPHVLLSRPHRLHGQIPILDPYAFARADENQPGCLPHCWMVTSDSVAARAARLAGARELILLKSVSSAARFDCALAAKSGLVDAYFPEAVGDSLAVRSINFRCWPTG